MTGKQLKDSILQWAIRGKLVPQDPNDEPASVLLERIRAEKQRLIKEKKIKKQKNESIIYRGDDNSYYEKFADGRMVCIDEEIPFEIPESWCWERVSNIFILNPKIDAKAEIDAAFIPMEAITACYGSEFRYYKKKWGEIKNGFTHFADGDIAFAKITPCFQNRKSVILRDLPNGIGAGTTELRVLRAYNDTIIPLYVLYFLESSYFVDEASFKGTANQQRIIPGYLESKLFPIPPKKEQIRIVEQIKTLIPIIDRYGKSQSLLNNLNGSINVLLRKSILQEAIQGKLVPQNPADEPASELLKRIKEEKECLVKAKKIKADKNESVIFKGDDNCYYEKLSDGTLQLLELSFNIPSNWEWVRLGDLVYNMSGLAYKKEDLDVKHETPIRVLRGGNISEGSWCIKDDDVKIAPQFVNPDLLLKAGTFITPAVSSLEQVGKTGLIEEDLSNVVVGGFVLMLVPFIADTTLLHYLLYLFQTPFYKTRCQSIVNKSGQAFYNLSRAKLMNTAIPLPPLQEQARMVSYLNKIFTNLQ